MNGFLAENLQRSYPIEPQALSWANQFIADCAVFYGSDIQFDIATDRSAITHVAVGATIDVTISVVSDTVRDPIVVSIDPSAQPFTVHHAETTGGTSYVYLTAGLLSSVQAFADPGGTQLVLEDRTVIAQFTEPITSIEVINGPTQQSFQPSYSVVDPLDPAANYTAAKGAYTYDALSYGVSLGTWDTQPLTIVPGRNIDARIEQQDVTFSLVVGSLTAQECCDVTPLPIEQTTRRTARSLLGLLPDAEGNVSIRGDSSVVVQEFASQHEIRLVVEQAGGTSCAAPNQEPPEIPGPPQ